MFRNDEDTAWKKILDAHLKDFIEYCFPKLSEFIDWGQSWTSLDKELQVIAKGNISGKQLLDKLFKVSLKNGCEQWVLVHIEIQAEPEKNFSERMFVYGYRAYDKYKKPIVSLAVLTDQNRKWRPDTFEIGLAGSYIKSKFLVLKVIDFQNKKNELKLSHNPFANVLLIQLYAMESKKYDSKRRKEVKFMLIRRFYVMGYSREYIYNFFIFIDSLIGLPNELEVEYLNEVYDLEEDLKVAYITTAERFGFERGVQEGIQQGLEQGIEQGLREGQKNARETAIRMLNKGFHVNDIAEVTLLSHAEIKLLRTGLNAEVDA